MFFLFSFKEFKNIVAFSEVLLILSCVNVSFMQVGTDLADAARSKDVCYKQPFLLAVGPMKQPTQYVMVVDQLSIPAGDSTVTALDMLFKSYYCFNVEFPLAISQFWEFFAFDVYGVMNKKEAKPQVRSLASVIRGLEAK